MAITTIEGALADMARTLTTDPLVKKARDAVAQGNVLEVTILVSPARQGAAVTMHSLVASDRVGHGRLIRLS